MIPKKRLLRLSVACFVFAAMIGVFGFAGCAARQKNVTNLPAGVTLTQVQAWDSAVANLDKIASSTTAARQAIIALHAQGVIPDGVTYGKILTALARIDQAQISAAAFLKAYPNTWSPGLATQMQAYMNDISAQLQAITNDGLVGIKNADSQKQVSALIAEITSFVNIILTL